MKALPQQILKGSIGLSIFAIVTAGLIAVTQIGTADRISQEIKKAQSKALLQIIPAQEHDNELIEDSIALTNSTLLGFASDGAEGYTSRMGGDINAIILPVVAPDGYTGAINMIIGISKDGIIKGVRVLSHKETPGLGDKVDIKKSSWIKTFDGKSLNSPNTDKWKVVKDGGEFDQFTGATITPRAVVSAVHKALIYFDANKAQLLKTTTSTVDQSSSSGETP